MNRIINASDQVNINPTSKPPFTNIDPFNYLITRVKPPCIDSFPFTYFISIDNAIDDINVDVAFDIHINNPTNQ